LADIEPDAFSSIDSHEAPGPFRITEIVPWPTGTIRVMPAALASAPASTPEARSRISACGRAGPPSKRMPACMAPPKAVASETSSTANSFLTWMVAATSARLIDPAAARAADSLRSMSAQPASPASASLASLSAASVSGVNAESREPRSMPSKASEPDRAGRLGLNSRLSAPSPRFPSSARAAFSNFTRLASPTMRLVNVAEPRGRAGATGDPHHRAARWSEGTANLASPST
jgi:hypothetical protein